MNVLRSVKSLKFCNFTIFTSMKQRHLCINPVTINYLFLFRNTFTQWFSTFFLPRTTQRCYIAVAHHQVIEDFNLLKIYCKMENTHNDTKFNVRVALIASRPDDPCGVGPSSRHIGSHVQVHKDEFDPWF